MQDPRLIPSIKLIKSDNKENREGGHREAGKVQLWSAGALATTNYTERKRLFQLGSGFTRKRFRKAHK